MNRLFSSDEKYYLLGCCCPIYVMTVGRIMAVMNILAVVYDYEDIYTWKPAKFFWVPLINLSLLYGMFKNRRYYILPMFVCLVLVTFFNAVLIVSGIFLSVAGENFEAFSRIDKALDFNVAEDEDLSKDEQSLLVFVILLVMQGIAIWMLQIMGRSYCFLKEIQLHRNT